MDLCSVISSKELLSTTVFKEKKEKKLSESLGQGVRFFFIFPWCADLLAFPYLPLDAILPMWSTRRFTQGVRVSHSFTTSLFILIVTLLLERN